MDTMNKKRHPANTPGGKGGQFARADAAQDRCAAKLTLSPQSMSQKAIESLKTDRKLLFDLYNEYLAVSSDGSKRTTQLADTYFRVSESTEQQQQISRKISLDMYSYMEKACDAVEAYPHEIDHILYDLIKIFDKNGPSRVVSRKHSNRCEEIEQRMEDCFAERFHHILEELDTAKEQEIADTWYSGSGKPRVVKTLNTEYLLDKSQPILKRKLI